jgi:hypothetical protein
VLRAVAISDSLFYTLASEYKHTAVVELPAEESEHNAVVDVAPVVRLRCSIRNSYTEDLHQKHANRCIIL